MSCITHPLTAAMAMTAFNSSHTHHPCTYRPCPLQTLPGPVSVIAPTRSRLLELVLSRSQTCNLEAWMCCWHLIPPLPVSTALLATRGLPLVSCPSANLVQALDPSPSSSPQELEDKGSERKAATVVLTEEEQRLLEEEGISLPTDMPLTKVGWPLAHSPTHSIRLV